MVKILTPAYGTALNYGSGIRVEEPMFAAAVFTSWYRRQALLRKTQEFLDMGIDKGRSIDGISTHTMRCSRNFIPNENVAEFNRVAVEIAQRARDTAGRKQGILVLGDMGVMGDCYRSSSAATSIEQAADYHHQQAKILADASVDALWAETVGNTLEAEAFTQVAQAVGRPLYLSLVVREDGFLLDGTPIEDLVAAVDRTGNGPRKILTNCTWETGTRALYQRAKEQGVVTRLGGFYTNATNVDHAKKQELHDVKRYGSVQEYITWVQAMLKEFPHLASEEDSWMSGCCGFGADDIDQLMKSLT